MQLASPSFPDQAAIPTEFTCKGAGTRPVLTIQQVPENAQSLAIIMHDPDAVNGDFTHWIAWNIPAKATDIAADQLPLGAMEGVNDGAGLGYYAPCPPDGSGTHRYTFELYALDTILSLPEGGSRQELEEGLQGHILAQTQFVGTIEAG